MNPAVEGPARPASAREALLRARAERRCAVIPYLTLGYPTLAASLALLDALEAAGADVVELGVPFSDPVADGPTIQRTIEVALAQGVTLRSALAALAARPAGGARVLFSYLNPLLALGLSRLPTAMFAAGARAALVTDLVVEEAATWLPLAAAHGVETCFLIAATSDRERMQRAAAASSGFVYCVSTLGVTGVRAKVDAAAEQTVRRLREVSQVPVAVGFGLRSAEDVAAVARFADAAVVGSALLNALGDARDPGEVAARGVAFLTPLLAAARA